MSTIFWGAAGTATVQLTIPEGKNKIIMKTLEGCLVKKDANLRRFIEENFKDQSADRNKLERSKYLFYAPDSDFQRNVTAAALTYPKISKTRGKTRQKMKGCTVEDPLIIRVHGHLFLCCDSQLKESKFLDEHCKEVRTNQSLDCSKKFYGLGSEENGQLVFTPFGMSQYQSSYGLLERSDYEKLKDAGPLLLDDNKTAVGFFRKTNDCRILVLIFGINQGGSSTDSTTTAPPGDSSTDSTRTHPAGGSASDSIPTAPPGDSSTDSTPTAPPGDSSDQTPTAPPADSSTDSPLTAPPGDSSTDSTPNAPSGDSSTDSTPTAPADGSSTDSTPTPPPVCLKVLFQKDAGVLQALGRQYLDRHSLVIKNHENLADLLKAPPSIKEKCKSNTKHSPTLDLLQLSQVSKRSVNELVLKLKEMPRKDVAEILEVEIPENERQQSITNALNDYPEVFEEKVASELDKNGMFNWQKLGVKLEIRRDELNQIKMGCNPAKQLLEDYVYPTLEKEKLTVECFRQHITTMGRRDILDLLDEFGITQQDDGQSIKDVIKPDSERMWKLCLLLNKCVTGLKDWKTLAYLWGIEHAVYSQFKPSTRVSPTKILLEEWLTAERPQFTANALCSLLGEIQRNDAKEFLENKLQEHFSI